MTLHHPGHNGSEGTEGVRRTTDVTSDLPLRPDTSVSDTEVVARAARRRLSLAYKLNVLETVTYLRTQGHGAVGAYLRQEGLYYSSVRAWERLHANGELTARRKGAKGKNRDTLLAENKTLRRKLEHSEKRLAKTELLVELQKKLSSILDLDSTAHEKESSIHKKNYDEQ